MRVAGAAVLGVILGTLAGGSIDVLAVRSIITRVCVGSESECEIINGGFSLFVGLLLTFVTSLLSAVRASRLGASRGSSVSGAFLGRLAGGIAGAVGFIAVLPLALHYLTEGLLPLPALLLAGLLLAAIPGLILLFLIFPSILRSTLRTPRD